MEFDASMLYADKINGYTLFYAILPHLNVQGTILIVVTPLKSLLKTNSKHYLKQRHQSKDYATHIH